MAQYENLAGFYVQKQDGGLDTVVANSAPKVLIAGTASKGYSSYPYTVQKDQEAASLFGTSGSLIRGMYEVRAGKASNITLFRIGATPAELDGIGVVGLTGGLNVRTADADDSVNTRYLLFWDESEQRLVITNDDSDLVVFDCDDWAPMVPSIDRGEVFVSGTPDGSGATIGTLVIPLTLAAVGVGPYDVTYIAATDGTNPSRMKLYELLFEAYEVLENVAFDEVLPMDIYLDDSNAADMTSAQKAALAFAAGAYPVTNSFNDALLYFYTESYNGENMFWWRRNGEIEEEEFLLTFPNGYGLAAHNLGTPSEINRDADFVAVYNMAGLYYTFDAAINATAYNESATAVDFAITGAWESANLNLVIDTETATGVVHVLDADCNTTSEVVTLINLKIAAGSLTGDIEAYRVDESHIGIRRTSALAGVDLFIEADVTSTANAGLGLTAGTYGGNTSTAATGTFHTAATGSIPFGAALYDGSTAIEVAAAFAAAAVVTGVSFTDNGNGTVSVVYDVAGNPTDVVTYDNAETTVGTVEFGHVVKNVPDVFPAGYSVTSPSGVVLAEENFHEVNFAYQVANFCYVNSVNNTDCFTAISVRPPLSLALKDVSNWIGQLPVYTTATNGSQTIASASDNGTGLAGNKFMAGRADFRAAAAGGGFIATDTGFMDGAELTDLGGLVIDIGKYLNIVASWPNLSTPFSSNGLGYITSGAPLYAGMVSNLDPKSAPTNKIVPKASLPWRMNNRNIDMLVGLKYVVFREKSKGVVVADAPTAARGQSSWRRLTTVRIAKEVIDALRLAADPFIGNAGGKRERAALQTACESVLKRLQEAGYIQRYDLAITATTAQIVNGEVDLNLVLVPAFETRQVNLIVSLAAQ